MGLFDGKAKLESAENEVMQKLSQVPLLDDLIRNLLEEENEPWIWMSQGYYDNCRRVVTIGPDAFEIKWVSYQKEQYIGKDGQVSTKRVENMQGRVGYSYTKSGYIPLHRYVYDSGKKEIPTQRVCCLWASVVRERMAAKMPNCMFHEVKEDASFIYIVPSLSFKDWF